MPADATIEPFRLHVHDRDIADLKTRLRLTRFPDQAPEAPWAFGTDLAFMHRAVDHWRDRFDWRAEEARLNAFPQFLTEIDRIPVHFLHVAGRGPTPVPLLL